MRFRRVPKPRYAQGGYIKPREGDSDTVPAILSPGCYYTSDEVLEAYGTELLDRLNQISRPSRRAPWWRRLLRL